MKKRFDWKLLGLCVISFVVAFIIGSGAVTLFLMKERVLLRRETKETISSSPGWSLSLPKTFPLGGQSVLLQAQTPKIVEMVAEPSGTDDPIKMEENLVGKGQELSAEEMQIQNNLIDTQAHNQMMNILIQQAERRRLVWKIDTWLAQKGSPMIGCGEYYVQNQERTGIPATLSVGIADAESTSGLRTYNHLNSRGEKQNKSGGNSYNAWGMIGDEYAEGFMSWQEGIAANFDFLMKNCGPLHTPPLPLPQTMHDCSGYCVGDGTMKSVDDVQAMINSFDASSIH